MKAHRMVKAGQPAELCEVPVPEPGPGQVLLRVGGAGLCHSDLHLMHAPQLANLPFTLGHETAGWVAALGAGVEGLELDSPVAVHGAWGCGLCRWCQSDEEQLCERAAARGVPGSGLGRDGGIAEYLLVPAARHLVPLGDLEPRDAAPLDDAALTPYRVIKRHLHRLTPDATAVVIGVGGLGHMAVQILRALCSSRIVAVDSAPQKLELARQLGADEALASHDEIAREMRDLMGARGASLVCDFVGYEATMQLGLSLLQPLGHLAVVGAGMGKVPYGFAATAYDSSVGNTFWGNLAELREVVALAQAGRLKVYAEHAPIEATAAAYRRLEAGQVTGRAVITPNG